MMQSQCPKMKMPKCNATCAGEKTHQARLAVVGINYKTSTLQEREPLQLAIEELPRIDDLLASHAGVMEAAAVCTCNRIEFYLVLREQAAAFDVVAAMYREYRDLDIVPLRGKFYERTEDHAVRHVSRLAAGLNSMVLGETQIFGQIKKAYSTACSIKAAGKILHRLFHLAFRIGKRVREETTIGRGAVSVGGVAARLVGERLADRTDPVILFIGVNEMISLAAEHLCKAGYQRCIFANRTVENARRLADHFGGSVCSLDDLAGQIGEADVVITCTGSSAPVITKPLAEDALGRSAKKDILIMDLGVPRDVENAAGALPGITLFDLDDIHRELNAGLEERASAIKPAEEIVEAKVEQFMYWYEAVRREPIYNGLGQQFENIRAEELRAILNDCPTECRATVEKFSVRLIRRLLQQTCRQSE
ncbi:glutamyl-tRNA reductase [Candidatus Zixiibacteriota bacterium]